MISDSTALCEALATKGPLANTTSATNHKKACHSGFSHWPHMSMADDQNLPRGCAFHKGNIPLPIRRQAAGANTAFRCIPVPQFDSPPRGLEEEHIYNINVTCESRL
jgi:hypothetical protein